jgi:hypothetical protein
MPSSFDTQGPGSVLCVTSTCVHVRTPLRTNGVADWRFRTRDPKYVNAEGFIQLMWRFS